jgi:hypothetical protein
VTTTFSPSIDWGAKFLRSATWVFVAFVFAAAMPVALAMLAVRTTEWGRQFARITGDMQFTRKPVDTLDQRIQQDIDIFTTGVGSEPNNPSYTSNYILVFGAVEAVLSAVSFGVILWELSSPLTWLGVTLPKALFWIAMSYVLTATVIAFAIGRPMIWLSYVNELRNASFRYALVRLREAGAAPPASSSASPSPGCCRPGPRRCSSTNRPRRWTRVWS